MATANATLDDARFDETFAALANGTRRANLARLADGEASVNELAAPFDLTLPAISKHIKVLERAGLITRGRRADPALPHRRCTTRRRRSLDRAVPTPLGRPIRPHGDLRPRAPGQRSTEEPRHEGAAPVNHTKDVQIERTFDAPIDLIWAMWTEAEHFAAWYLAGEREQVLKDHLDTIRRLAEWLRARADQGEAAGVEARRLELEVEVLSRRLAEANAEARARKAAAATWSWRSLPPRR